MNAVPWRVDRTQPSRVGRLVVASHVSISGGPRQFRGQTSLDPVTVPPSLFSDQSASGARQVSWNSGSGCDLPGTRSRSRRDLQPVRCCSEESSVTASSRRVPLLTRPHECQSRTKYLPALLGSRGRTRVCSALESSRLGQRAEMHGGVGDGGDVHDPGRPARGNWSVARAHQASRSVAGSASSSIASVDVS